MRGEGEGGRREEGGKTVEKRGLRTGEEKSQIDALNYLLPCISLMFFINNW
jgi:hypothetical protein